MPILKGVDIVVKTTISTPLVVLGDLHEYIAQRKIIIQQAKGLLKIGPVLARPVRLTADLAENWPIYRKQRRLLNNYKESTQIASQPSPSPSQWIVVFQKWP